MYFSYNIYSYVEKMKNKKWAPNINSMLDKKTLLIIGYGNNGICLAKKAKAFNMKIIGVKKRINEDFPGKEYLNEFYSMENLPDKIINEADYIYATLTDEDIINDVMGIFRQYYPNTVRIDYDNAHTREAVLEASGKEAESRTFAELISDFYRQIYGCEISEEELGVMQEAAAAAGVAGAGGDMDTSMAGPSGRGPEGRDISGGSSNHTGLVKEEGRQDS